MINKKRERQEEVKKVKEIPGFYYDYEKNRYFSNKNAHNQSYSDFLSNKNKTIVKNKMIDFSFNINLFNKIILSVYKIYKVEDNLLSNTLLFWRII